MCPKYEFCQERRSIAEKKTDKNLVAQNEFAYKVTFCFFCAKSELNPPIAQIIDKNVKQTSLFANFFHKRWANDCESLASRSNFSASPIKGKNWHSLSQLWH